MKIGLVLSGGMAKGAYQVGALKAINEIIPLEDIKCISCASIGALNGYAYATDNLEGIENMWKNICNEDSRLFINQILRSSMLQQNIVNLYNPEKELSQKFYTTYLNADTKNIVYKNLSAVDKEDVLPYLKASVAMPIYNRAVKVGKYSYFDGAMIDNIPVFPLKEEDLDYILCIYFDDNVYKFENNSFDKKVIKITFPHNGFVKQSLVFRKDGIEKMIDAGYEKTLFILKTMFAEGYDNLDYIYNAIKYMNNQSKNLNLRVTGDLLVTNLNKITQKLTNKKII